MAVNSRDALNQLIQALEDHLNLVESKEAPHPRDLEAAEDELRDAFFTYDDMLFTEYDVELPLEILDEEDLLAKADDFGDELDFEELDAVEFALKSTEGTGDGSSNFTPAAD